MAHYKIPACAGMTLPLLPETASVDARQGENALKSAAYTQVREHF
jgi:hypothetical protein